MIKYRLICKNCDLSFDSWFASSFEFDKLKRRKILICHKCNSQNVEKNLMAPKLINKSKNENFIEKNLKFKKINKKIKEYQNLLREILIMLVKISLMRQDPFIIIIKKSKKEFMEKHQKKKLKSLKKKV